MSWELTDASKGEPVARKLESLLKSAQRKRDLRDSTVESYRRFLTRMGFVDDSLSLEEFEARLLGIANVNTRRSTLTAIRAVLGAKLKFNPGYRDATNFRVKMSCVSRSCSASTNFGPCS